MNGAFGQGQQMIPDPDSEKLLSMIENIGDNVGDAYGVKPLPKTMPAEQREDTHYKRAITGYAAGLILGLTSFNLGQKAVETVTKPDPFHETNPTEEITKATIQSAGATSAMASAWFFGAFGVGECIKAWRASKEDDNKPKPPRKPS